MAQDGEPTESAVAGWSRLHGVDVSGSPVVVGWLRLVHACARPVRRVPPDVLSAIGVLCAAGAVAVAAAGGRWPLLAALLVVLTGLLDGLDGAVALLTGRARPLGAVVDAVADRLGDMAFVGVLVVLGAPAWWCAAVAAAVLLHEYARARAQGAGMTGAGAVTVAERPTRVIVTTVVAVGAGVFPGGAPGPGWAWGLVGAVTWSALAAVGLVQLAVGIKRSLAEPRG
ncbi:CDP-alcohol phosphatidyltransferase family protein [Actinokineospora sp. NBRC 105648]|uniref:CDP-alcohol phosphatidyltransferase family protein n=1 Tax=Actinokineospora sp. NBRC 105648 TaxID=3032206 RepID=UPI0024A2D679|nr:CDP-alcohol phosphatidyltransferase family protein [Actinokineospora sp. NBRC 105648]GLZ40539.1 CDP-diacylglycerol--glycerol-3-phosphate 3-phosphatidyltransferase [Actinokineospora sp. NBRC 105648]